MKVLRSRWTLLLRVGTSLSNPFSVTTAEATGWSLGAFIRYKHLNSPCYHKHFALDEIRATLSLNLIYAETFLLVNG